MDTRKFKVTYVALPYYLFFCATLDCYVWNTPPFSFLTGIGKVFIKSN